VGRGLLSAVIAVAGEAWADGVRSDHLLPVGVAAFLAGLAVHQFGDWWTKHRDSD
jgi:hypothetical protein